MCSSTAAGTSHGRTDRKVTVTKSAKQERDIYAQLTLIEPLHKQGLISLPSVGSGPSRQILHCLFSGGVELSGIGSGD
jgi:hypothetical protein